MLDWLRKPVAPDPVLMVAGQALPVHVRRLANAKRLTLRLAPDGSAVRLSMPRWAPLADGLDFARSRTAWLAQQLAQQQAQRQPSALADGALICFGGAPHILRHDPAAPRRVELNDGTISLGGPAANLAPRLQRWLQAQAKALFAQDLAFYCARAGQAVPTLALSSAKARWGSCSSRGVVRLNWRLLMAPAAVRRSVVAHEVAHLVHFNHSPAFHALLEHLFEGDLAAANLWLRQHGRSLYAPLG